MSKLDMQLEKAIDLISPLSPVSKSSTLNVCMYCQSCAPRMKYKYKISLKELRSSLNHRSREYLLQNTLHGVPYFVDQTRPKWERLMWLLLTLASMLAIVTIIVIVLNKFETDPTITGLDIMTEHINIEFPQAFICFDWAALNHSYIRQNEVYLYTHLYNWTWGKDIDLTSFIPISYGKNHTRAIFQMMGPECDYIITECAYRGINISCSKVFIKVLVSVGACCKSTNLEPLNMIDVSWNLEFKISSSSFPLRFYFGQQSDSGPKPGERSVTTAYFPVDIEFVADITYTTPDIRYLLLRQRKCYYEQEAINFNDCEISCAANKMFERCNCLPWLLSSTGKTECPPAKYSCLNEVAIDAIQCNCWLPCDHTSYTVKRIRKSSKDVNRIMLRTWPTALYKREMRFGYFDLLVSFGGIASLFLGYSLLTSVELGYYFSLRTYCGAVVQSSRKQYNIMTVSVVEKPLPKLDINPTYYQYVD